MKILFFGSLADTIGREASLDRLPSGCTVADLRAQLVQLHPTARTGLGSDRSRAYADDVMVSEDHVVTGTNELAFLPPLSGG